MKKDSHSLTNYLLSNSLSISNKDRNNRLFLNLHSNEERQGLYFIIILPINNELLTVQVILNKIIFLESLQDHLDILHIFDWKLFQ